ncbi:Probable lipoprotein precursor [Tenacibaculum maritimum]|uniref:hypothetical protein n=2 Tax=Tenacibaculum maritimum TaxID=107401 RepID=UPI0012E51A8B|nr:hypothetical protein [Tenacibaculum maritimum]CAA0143845.1 Probable lipoprotein precursor [Tenacibaculum maritimum]CAA0163790.1 Probable lipoprotein precursor [Tenacibaculum maritimum]CAA0178346.1 Probable lipoprotein precursor [Tenacibaculum maritimum]CAA0178437.1 Probable lipoprotein precursor [Tenacibaculum maritimum]CAA0215940.1 Probable lipoprotein precursor [Tenacibaculum maritimum]
MKKINIIITLLFATLYGCGQNNGFEKKMDKFRFSLNKELEKYDNEKIYNLKFDKNDSMIIMIDSFVSKNEKEIKIYRENILKKYENNPDFKFNTEKYIKVDLDKINDSLDELNLSKDVPLSKLLWIDPIVKISSFKTIYFLQEKEVEELAVFNAKISITSSQIKTRKINKSQWEIIDNSYDVVSKFIYDLNQGKVMNIEIFEKK